MYEIGDYVIYGDSGVCRVTAIGKPPISRADPKRTYYTLTSVFGSETIHIPVDTKVFMRPIISRVEAEQLIRQIPSIEKKSINGRCIPSVMSEQYLSSFRSHECGDLVQLIKTIYEKNSGKKPGRMDEKYLHRAEELLHGELSIALGIDRSDVPEYIAQIIEEKNA